METLGLIGILALWGAIGLAPAWALFAASRGRASVLVLPLSMIAGIGGGALVPAFGAKGWGGFGVSIVAAGLGGVVCLLVLARLPWMRA